MRGDGQSLHEMLWRLSERIPDDLIARMARLEKSIERLEQGRGNWHEFARLVATAVIGGVGTALILHMLRMAT